MSSTNCFGLDAFDIIDGSIISSIRRDFTCVKIESSITEISNGSKVNYPFQQSANSITTVDFSNAVNLRKIGDFAFYNCRLIQSIDLTQCSKLEYIGYGAFFHCDVAQSIIFPAHSYLTKLMGGCLCYCKAITTFTIPQTIEIIDAVISNGDGNEGVFTYCSKLSEIIFASTSKVSFIGEKAFYMTALQSITFPASLTKITPDAFRVCNSLRTIYVDEGNTVYSAQNGILLSKDGTELVYFPNSQTESTTVTLPESVTTIGARSFMGISRYSSVSLTNVKYLNDWATCSPTTHRHR